MTDGDGCVVGGHFGDVCANVIVEGEVASLCEEEDAGSGELFGGGGDVEDGVGGYGFVVFEIGHPVTALVDDVAILDYCEHAAGGICFIPFGEEGVCLVKQFGHFSFLNSYTVYPVSE